MSKILAFFRGFDIAFLVAIILLQILGLILLYGTTLSNQETSIFYKQLLFAGVGWVIFIFFSVYNYQSLARANKVLYPLMLALLVYVLFFSRDIRGSSRWIDLGFFQLQPAEFAKFVLVVVLARWFSLRHTWVNAWKYMFITLLLMLVPFFLVLLEPDLGSALILGVIWLAMVLLSPVKRRILLGLFLGFLVVSASAWQYVLHDYQKTRIAVFLDPSLDPRGKGYNVRQAIIAVGSGGLTGKGLGRGLQSQLKFLPERQTDFIFASSAEEIGFLGVSLLISLYAFISFRLFYYLSLARDYLARYLVGGVFAVFLVQVLINIGMNIGIMPVTGIPLPFLSYGGSSLFVFYIFMGVVQNIYWQSKTVSQV